VTAIVSTNQTLQSALTAQVDKNVLKAQIHTKVVTRHVWQDYLKTVEDLRHSAKGKELYTLRSQSIERIFADGKEKHGLRYTCLNGLAKVKSQVLLTATVLNLKS